MAVSTAARASKLMIQSMTLARFFFLAGWLVAVVVSGRAVVALTLLVLVAVLTGLLVLVVLVVLLVLVDLVAGLELAVLCALVLATIPP